MLAFSESDHKEQTSQTSKTKQNIFWIKMYRQISNINLTLVGNKIVDHSDVVGASPFRGAPTTPSFST